MAAIRLTLHILAIVLQGVPAGALVLHEVLIHHAAQALQKAQAVQTLQRVQAGLVRQKAQTNQVQVVLVLLQNNQMQSLTRA